MILLDTNVISELIRPTPTAAVTAYLLRQDPAALLTTAICEAELRYGLARLPAGRRRDDLTARVADFLAAGFKGQILRSTVSAPRIMASFAPAGRRGRPITVEDAMIAAIARAHGAALATRNGRDFADCGIAVVDPWEAKD